RRRHTRSYGDWSSDVCSSDLMANRRVGFEKGSGNGGGNDIYGARACSERSEQRCGKDHVTQKCCLNDEATQPGAPRETPPGESRSEERRVGKEWRSEFATSGE